MSDIENLSKKMVKVKVGIDINKRFDKTLTALIPAHFGISRSRLRSLISLGAVKFSNGEALGNTKVKLEPGDEIIIALDSLEVSSVVPEKMKLEVLFEDDSLIVINKPAGIIVHPATGINTGTLVNGLLDHCSQLSKLGGELRPGIVHRLDKGTSGVLVIAKTDRAYLGLVAQFSSHSVHRHYVALVWGDPLGSISRLEGEKETFYEGNDVFRIDAKVGRHKFDRKKMAVKNINMGRRAVTRFRVLRKFGNLKKPIASLIECWLETGRTHQIRVHLASIGFGLIGDPVYGKKARTFGKNEHCLIKQVNNFNHQALHAKSLGFKHPINDENIFFETEVPNDFANLVELLKSNK